MPFVVKPYDATHKDEKAKVGDTVYLRCRPDMPMTVSELPICNYAANHRAHVVTVWLDPLTNEMRRGTYFANELST
jgi:hypothetical protein